MMDVRISAGCREVTADVYFVAEAGDGAHRAAGGQCQAVADRDPICSNQPGNELDVRIFDSNEIAGYEDVGADRGYCCYPDSIGWTSQCVADLAPIHPIPGQDFGTIAVVYGVPPTHVEQISNELEGSDRVG